MLLLIVIALISLLFLAFTTSSHQPELQFVESSQILLELLIAILFDHYLLV